MPPTRWKPSVTVAAIVEHEGRFLLVEEETSEGLRLNNPAGHLDPGESPLQAVVRETLEETTRAFVPSALLGLYLSRQRRPGNGTVAGTFTGKRTEDDITYLRLAFVGAVGAPNPARTLDAGIVRSLWLTPAEIHASLARHRSPLVWRCVQDHLAGVRLPLSAISTDPSVFHAGSTA
jgi:8-oxo-dGTP pyrophosphatase MutT (NUDIX family)